MSSFFKYIDNQGAAKNLHWNRASLDGAPFRGKKPPILKDEEYEQLAERVDDAHVKTFDMSKPEDVEEYTRIIDAAVNNWYTIWFRERKFSEKLGTWLVLVEWSEPYMELPNIR